MKTLLSRSVFFVMLILSVASLLYANFQKTRADQMEQQAHLEAGRAQAALVEAEKLQELAREQLALAEMKAAEAGRQRILAQKLAEKCK